MTFSNNFCVFFSLCCCCKKGREKFKGEEYFILTSHESSRTGGESKQNFLDERGGEMTDIDLRRDWGTKVTSSSSDRPSSTTMKSGIFERTEEAHGRGKLNRGGARGEEEENRRGGGGEENRGGGGGGGEGGMSRGAASRTSSGGEQGTSSGGEEGIFNGQADDRETLSEEARDGDKE